MLIGMEHQLIFSEVEEDVEIQGSCQGYLCMNGDMGWMTMMDLVEIRHQLKQGQTGQQ